MENVQRIMVVDDEKEICQNVEKILGKGDFEIVTARSAKEALELMAKQSFELLISDIVMPEMNGLSLLKLAKQQWPLTKAIIMTAYASTDTAMKAIRLGALDYIQKPFTPDELRTTVDNALSGKLAEAAVAHQEREAIEVIGIDIPYDRDEVVRQTSEDYADRLNRSDMPEMKIAPAETLENYCALGEMVCDIFKKLGSTCKGGKKKNECPQKAKKAAAKPAGSQVDVKKLIGIDLPFDYEEVVAATSAEYVTHMGRDGFAFMPYEELKKSVPAVKTAPAEDVTAGDILVVDDEVAVNNNVRKILAKNGLSVDQALSKDEALAKVNRNSYKLVLLDLRMPGVQGLELLKAITETRPETRVVIITGYASIETAVESARIGAIDYLPKPFTPDDLRQVTGNALRLAA
ncbi:MAG: response regulator [Thermodesulfobacteriota bacterium]